MSLREIHRVREIDFYCDLFKFDCNLYIHLEYELKNASFSNSLKIENK